MDGPDQRLRTREALAQIFEHFGEIECPQLDAHLYRALCRGIVGNAEVLALAAHAPAHQPAPNLLFAAVHDLLLRGEPHPLRDWYPALATGAVREPATSFPVFREFCMTHRDRLVPLIETRLTQTNVVQRCSVLLPAFAVVFAAGGGRPLALVEIGASAGLNLQWHRFRYAYDSGLRWGDDTSPVRVPCDLRGDAGLPPLPDRIDVASRVGVDLNPIDIDDADAVRWLRALVWPDHVGRQERLTAAIDIAREARPEVRTGDAAEALPELLATAPRDATLCVYGTHTLYQFPRPSLVATLKSMQAVSQRRPVHFLSMEGTGDRCSELQHTHYEAGERHTSLLARCNPHGRWLEWTA